MIISFGEHIDVQLSTEPAADRYTSFVAGLHDGFVFTEHGGRQSDVELRLTPLGAFLLLGVPSRELAHRVVEIEALGGRVVRQWFMLGAYDFLSVVEAPDERVISRLAVELASRGSASFETLPAIPVDELIESLGESAP